MATTGGGANKRATGKRKGRKKKKKNRTKLAVKSRTSLQLRRHHHHFSELIPLLISATTTAYNFLHHHDLHLLPHQSLSIESLISNNSFSISNLISLLSLPPPPQLPPPSNTAPSPWFHRLIADSSSDSDVRWTQSFNLSKPSFDLLIRLLTPSLSTLLPIPPNFALAAALYRLAHGASFSAVSRRFGLDSSSTACRVFYSVCKAINDKLGHLFELKSDINRVIVGFGWISLPNCCGAMGVEKFELDGDLMGENGILLVQALVDSEGRFLDVSAGWPGTVSPDRVLRQSKLYLGVEESKEYLNGPSFQLNDGNSIPQYVLGDSCFPLLPWLLTPYNGSNEEDEMSSAEMAFDSVHRRGMQLVGTAFGRVRERWKLLANKWKEQCVEAFPFVIVTCCLLHNFLIKCSEAMPDENMEHMEHPRSEEFPVFDGEVDESGKKIRDVLALHLCRVSQRG